MYWWCQEKIDVGHSWDLKGYRLQNSRVFFLKISKEIGKAWHKCLMPEAREPHFQPRSRPFVWLLARTWISKNTDCFAV